MTKSLFPISPARTAGLIYLVVVLTGILSLGYIPSLYINMNDAEYTYSQLTDNSFGFRVGIAAGFICYIAFLFLPLPLYRLLAHINRDAAILMVLLVVVSVPISLLNWTNKLDVLSILSLDADNIGMPREQLQTAIMLSLQKYSNGVIVAKIFWGLWLLPFGYLVFKSNMLPKLLGLFLILGCFGYLIDVFGRILFPEFSQSAFGSYVIMPASIGEIGTCLWLVIFGARNRNLVLQKQQN